MLEDPQDATYLSVANLAEVVDVLVRALGHAVDVVDERLAWLAAGRLVTLAVHIALASALELRTAIATSDAALARAAQAEGCRLVALPDSRGRRPAAELPHRFR